MCGSILVWLPSSAHGVCFRANVLDARGPQWWRPPSCLYRVRIDRHAEGVASVSWLHHIGAEHWVMYGYGMELTMDEGGHVLFAEIEGMNVGVSAVLRHYPDTDIALVLLSNMRHSIWEARRAIHGMLLSDGVAA